MLRPLVETGLYFEGPRWHRGRLWFVDSLARSVLSVSLDGDCRKECELDGICGGIGFMPNGDLIATSMFDRKLLRYDGARVSLQADLSAVAAGTIDDMIVDGRGRIWVGDLGFDLMAGVVQGARGHIILVTPDGKARVAGEGLNFPNGIAVSQDGSTMVVAESEGDCLARFGIT